MDKFCACVCSAAIILLILVVVCDLTRQRCRKCDKCKGDKKMEGLKPCPFCGGKAKIFVIEKGVKSVIYCLTPSCGFHRHSYNNGDTDEHAALRLTTAWNRRVGED